MSRELIQGIIDRKGYGKVGRAEQHKEDPTTPEEEEKPEGEADSPDRAGAERSTDSTADAKREKEAGARALLKSAIDEFLRYAERIKREVEEGIDQGKGKPRGPRGVSYLFAVGGLYAASYATPSQRGFEADKRTLENRLEDERKIGDAIAKEDVLTAAEEFMPSQVRDITELLDRLDNWKTVYHQHVREEEFKPVESFKDMLDEVCAGLRKIKETI